MSKHAAHFKKPNEASIQTNASAFTFGKPSTSASSGETLDPAQTQLMPTLTDSPSEGAHVSISTTQKVPASASASSMPTISEADAPKDAPRTSNIGMLKHHRLWWSFIIIVVVLCAAYVAAGMYFGSHLMYRTTLGGRDVSFMDEQALSKVLAQDVENYNLHVSGQGADFTLTQADVNLSVDTEAVAAQTIQTYAPGYAWIMQLFHPVEGVINETPSFDEAGLRAKVGEYVDTFNKEATNPVDAFAQLDEASGAFVIQESHVGTALDKESVAKEIEQALTAFLSEATLSEESLLKPTLTADNPDLKAITDKANKALDLQISVMYKKEELAQITKALLAKALHVADTKTLSCDQSAIETWGQDEVLPKINTNDSTKIPKINYEKLTQLLNESVNNLANTPIALPVSILRTTPAGAPPESEGAHERGRHIDINLTNQYARLYDESGGILWQSWLVSGKNGPHATPTGTYSINSKNRNQTLIGADTNHDGEPDYKSHVDYWMPFIGNMVGLHDAPWRRAFGGKIYQSSGSHGCINLPPSKAAELYGLINVGDTVIVHW